MLPHEVGSEVRRRGGDPMGREEIKGPHDDRFFKPADSGLQADLRKSRDVDLHTQPEVRCILSDHREFRRLLFFGFGVFLNKKRCKGIEK